MNEQSKYCKRLIEVDLPIKRISAHARREKSIRHGHISTLHLWWARRPLAACRAVLCASLWPDPADPLCPEEFKIIARQEMLSWSQKHLDLLGPDSFSHFVHIQKNNALLEDDLSLRKVLLDFIAEFANWNNSTVICFIETSRILTRIAYESMGGIMGNRPMVADPFAGGGAIPIEALRVGAEAFSSDLNPVAVLLNKIVLEYIPRYGHELANAVREWGDWIKKEAEKEIGEFYPIDSDGATPIAYLRARTIRCEGPGCGAEVPLIRSQWLAKKQKRSIAIKIVPDYHHKNIDFKIEENKKARDVKEGTVKRGSATCPLCGYTTPVAAVRRQLKERHGGADDARLFCVVTTRPNVQGRFYRLPNEQDFETTKKARQKLEDSEIKNTLDFSLVPDEPLPIMSGVFNAPLYGHNTWGSLFTSKQALALTTLVRLIKKVGCDINQNTQQDFFVAVKTCLALAVDKQCDLGNALTRWKQDAECPVNLFGRQAIPMVWDFAETNVLSNSSGAWKSMYERTAYSIDHGYYDQPWYGYVTRASALNHPLPNDSVNCFFTDPPYYNAVPYADLSDFFYVWLKRSIGDLYPDLFLSKLAPKDEEICEMAGWDPIRYPEKDGKWFENMMAQAMAEGCRVLSPDGIGVVVFAHKSTEGWEAQLQAMADAGWIITASWPIDTEMGSRLRAMNSAALASSIHLVCRPRENPDGSLRNDFIGDWRDVLQELPRRIHEWMPRLAENGVVGADAIFACLGPALEIFSRYSSVEKPNGELVLLKEYMEHVWAAISREALSVVFSDADASGFEEDSRLTAIWLWTLSTAQGMDDLDSKATVVLNHDVLNDNWESEDDKKPVSKTKSAGYLLEYDTARKLAQGLGAHLDKLNSIVEIKGDTARLLPVEERARYLFGKDEDSEAVKKKAKVKHEQINLFDLTEDLEKATYRKTGQRSVGTPLAGSTVLDRVHQSMLLFATGRADAMKRFLVEDGIGYDQRFWKLAQALSALYPPSSDEKRWVDGVLARKKSLGL